MSSLIPPPPSTTDADRFVAKDGTPVITVTRAEQVTQEMVDWIVEEVDIRYPDRIDWEDMWDRLEGPCFSDGSYLEWGENDTPAMRKIQREVRKARR